MACWGAEQSGGMKRLGGRIRVLGGAEVPGESHNGVVVMAVLGLGGFMRLTRPGKG